MAEVIRYVNTASTPGGDGTTSATSGATRAYASLSEWEAAEQTDLVTAGDYHRVICIGGVLSDDVTVAGWTTADNNCIIIEVDSGSAHGGSPRSGFYLEKSLGFAALVNISQNWTILHGLDVVNTHASGRAIDATATGTASVILSKCIGQGVSAFYSAGGDNVLPVNCIALDSSTGFRFANWSSQYGYNCGAFNCTTGFTRGGTNGATKATLKNCVAFGCTTPYSTPLASYWKTADCSNNATDAAVTTDVPGSSALANVVSGDFTDSANDDWSLSSGSALAESGADLTTAFGSWDRTVFTLDEDDIAGNTRPQSTSWDIGPFELVSGGSGALSGSASITFSSSALLTGVGALTGTCALTFASNASLTGVASMTGSSSLTFSGSAALIGKGALSGASSISFAASGALTGNGSLTGAAQITFSSSALLNGTGALIGSSSLTFGSSATLTALGSGQMSGTSAMSFSTLATLSGVGALSGSSAMSFGSSAQITGTGTLSGAAALTFGTSATLVGTGDLVGAGSMVFGSSGTLVSASSGAMSGSASMSFGGSGALTGVGYLSGSSSLTFSGSGTFVAPESSDGNTPGIPIYSESRAKYIRKRKKEEEKQSEEAQKKEKHIAAPDNKTSALENFAASKKATNKRKETFYERPAQEKKIIDDLLLHIETSIANQQATAFIEQLKKEDEEIALVLGAIVEML